MIMSGTRKLGNGARLMRCLAVVVALSFMAAVSASAETVKITASDWRIKKPSKEYKDLPALMPKEQSGFRAGLGIVEFVCMKSRYYMLLVQPSVKLRDAEPATILTVPEKTSDRSLPIPLTFRNLYKSKTLLSRSMDWDADIQFAEVAPALLASLKTAAELELTLAGRSYAIGVSGLGSRMGPFQRFCEQGVVDNPAYFEDP